jgi:hypothetical protein
VRERALTSKFVESTCYTAFAEENTKVYRVQTPIFMAFKYCWHFLPINVNSTCNSDRAV